MKRKERRSKNKRNWHKERRREMAKEMLVERLFWLGFIYVVFVAAITFFGAK